ncbi:rhodanese-like domain-containing protein [Bacteriovoracaceae bacterium]|nr:rhodanese-like domain-containing protein [Bacteriovoracaceae bacterium]
MEVKEVTIDEAKKNLDGGTAVFIDVRDHGSFSQSHIDSATSLDDTNIEEYIANCDKDKMHIIYCYHGNSSKGAAAYFNSKGIKNSFSMKGGYAEWEDTFSK